MASMHWVCAFLFAVCLGQSAAAQDRSGSVGVSMMFPYEMEPSGARGDSVYAIDTNYFIEERWAVAASWEFGLEGAKRIDFAVGPQVYWFADTLIQPYCIGKFIYSFRPAKDMGWRFNIGAEWNMKAATGVDNLRLYYETGLSVVYAQSAPNVWNAEIARIGLLWSF